MADKKGTLKNQARLRRQRRTRARIHGTAQRPRLSVFRSLTNIFAQVIDDEKGFTLASASTIDKDLAAQVQGKSKTEAAKLVGQLVAERALKAGVEAVVFDRGGYQYHGRVAALAEGAREGGLKF
ncbi:MAG: 50S ribosomal protein L18 [Anaerolineae bacterium]|jgi:large subunit ribosomal protein L18|nr:50S ribosomal protein L18 [Anaerolineae bacterium]